MDTLVFLHQHEPTAAFLTQPFRQRLHAQQAQCAANQSSTSSSLGSSINSRGQLWLLGCSHQNEAE